MMNRDPKRARTDAYQLPRATKVAVIKRGTLIQIVEFRASLKPHLLRNS